jgi:hypothetical protein
MCNCMVTGNKNGRFWALIGVTHTFWHVYVLGLGYFCMALVTAHHRTFRDVTPGLWGGGVRKQWTLFIVVGVDVACRQCTECWVLPWKYNLHCCQAAKYLALLLTTISIQYHEFVFVIWHEKCKLLLLQQASKDIYMIGTFILKDGRYTFLFYHICHAKMARRQPSVPFN